MTHPGTAPTFINPVDSAFKGEDHDYWCRCTRCADNNGVARAHEPPFVVSVGSVGNTTASNGSNNGSNSNVLPLTRESNSSNGSNSLIANVRTGDWLSNAVFEPLTWAIDGILPEGFALLAGPPKAGKSCMALDWLLSVAAGGKALGQIRAGEPRRVLYLALEDSDRRMQDRCQKILGPDEPIPPLFCYLTEVEPNMVWHTIAEWMEAYPDTAMVVIDTIGKVMPTIKAGDTTYQRDYRLGASLHRFAQQHKGLTILGLHHTRKGASPDFVDAVSGTHGLAGAADTVMVLGRQRNSDEGTLMLTGRDVEEAEYAVVFSDVGWKIDGDDLSEAADAAHERKDTGNLSPKMLDLLDFIEKHPEGVTSKDAADKFGKSAYMMLTRLTEAGHIERPGGGRGRYVAVKIKKN